MVQVSGPSLSMRLPTLTDHVVPCGSHMACAGRASLGRKRLKRGVPSSK